MLIHICKNTYILQAHCCTYFNGWKKGNGQTFRTTWKISVYFKTICLSVRVRLATFHLNTTIALLFVFTYPYGSGLCMYVCMCEYVLYSECVLHWDSFQNWFCKMFKMHSSVRIRTHVYTHVRVCMWVCNCLLSYERVGVYVCVWILLKAWPNVSKV